MNPALRVKIRPMTVADVDRVMEIAAGLPNTPQWPRKAYMDALDPDFMPPRIALVAAQLKTEPLPPDPVIYEPMPDAILGYVVASLLPPQAELEIVAVAAHSQRQGLGQRLLAELEELLRRARIAEILLEVRASNQAAIGLYRRFGFNSSGLRTRYYVEPVEDAVMMARQIPAH